MAWSPLLRGPRAGGVGLLVLLLLGLLRPLPAHSARPVKEPHGLGAPVVEAGTPRRFRRAVPRGEAAGALQELARALAHLLEAERQERARAEAQEAEDQQARALAQLLRLRGAPRPSDPGLGQDDDAEAPAAQLARALLRARLDPAAFAAQLIPAPSSVLRTRPPAYDDGPASPEVEGAGEWSPEVDPELLRYLAKGGGAPAFPEDEAVERTLRSWEGVDILGPQKYLLGRLLTGNPDTETVAAPRRLRRAADQDLGPDVSPEGVLGALLRVKRLETPVPPAPVRRLLRP